MPLIRNLLILDLNGVLIDRNRNGGFVKKEHLDDFLSYAFDNFRIAIWTSAKRKNANALVKKIFTKSQQAQLLFVWTQSECKRVRNVPGKHYPLFLKNLSSVFSNFPLYHIDNTLIIDDTSEKLKNNAIKTQIIANGNLVKIREMLQEFMSSTSPTFYTDGEKFYWYTFHNLIELDLNDMDPVIPEEFQQDWCRYLEFKKEQDL